MADSSKKLTKRQLKKIIKAQESILKKEPGSLVARLRLAGAFQEMGKVAEALDQYHSVAEAYREEGKQVRVTAVCRSILEFAPKDEVALAMLEAVELRPTVREKERLIPEELREEDDAVSESDSSESESDQIELIEDDTAASGPSLGGGQSDVVPSEDGGALVPPHGQGIKSVPPLPQRPPGRGPVPPPPERHPGRPVPPPPERHPEERGPVPPPPERHPEERGPVPPPHKRGGQSKETGAPSSAQPGPVHRPSAARPPIRDTKKLVSGGKAGPEASPRKDVALPGETGGQAKDAKKLVSRGKGRGGDRKAKGLAAAVQKAVESEGVSFGAGGAPSGSSSASEAGPSINPAARSTMLGRVAVVKRAVRRSARPSGAFGEKTPIRPVGASSEPDGAMDDTKTPSREIPEAVMRRASSPDLNAVQSKVVAEPGEPTLDRDSGGPDELEEPTLERPSGDQGEPTVERPAGDQGEPTVERPSGDQGASSGPEGRDESLDGRVTAVRKDQEHRDGGPKRDAAVLRHRPPLPTGARKTVRSYPMKDPLGVPPMTEQTEELTADGVPPEIRSGGDEPAEASRDQRGAEAVDSSGKPEKVGRSGEPRSVRRTSPSLANLRQIFDAPDGTIENVLLDDDEEATFAAMESSLGRSRKTVMGLGGLSDLKTSSKKSSKRKSASSKASEGEGRTGGTSDRASSGVRASSDKKGSQSPGAEAGTGDVSELAVALENVALFDSLPKDALDYVRSRLVRRSMKAGDVVVKEGDPGNALFVLLHGRVVVEKQSHGDGNVSVAELGPGSFFGEFALLSDRKRHATVRAVTDCEVIEIARKVIGRLAKSHKDVARALRKFYRHRLLDTLSKATPFFEKLGDSERKALTNRLRFKRFGPGDAIIREGEEGGGFYLILVGEVTVTKNTASGTKELARLGEGSFFGEMSLMKGRPAMATVSAAVPTEVVEVGAQDFYKVVADYPQIWEEMDREVRMRELANHALLAGGPYSDEARSVV